MGRSEYDPAAEDRRPWNVGRMVGAKRALKPQQVWAIRFWLDHERRLRDRAMVPFMGSVLAPISRGESAKAKRVFGNTMTSPLDADLPYIFENAIHTLLSAAFLNVPSEAGASPVESNDYSDFWNGDAVQITFGFPVPVAIVDTRISKGDIRRHVFGGRSRFEANAEWPGFDLLDREAKLSGQEFTQARRVGAKAILAMAASLMKPIKTTRERR